jgi:Uncharacterized protein conserved in bacteria (DUF2255)
MVVLRWVMRLVAVLAVFVGLVFVGARFHDGPLGPIPGGPFASGAPVMEPVTDWSFATDVVEIELQLAAQSKSRTTWIVVHDGKAYVPAATGFPPGKTWHRVALEDGRATLRIAGKRYPVQLTKVDDSAVLAAVRDVALGKYPARPGGEVWFFAIASRPADA